MSDQSFDAQFDAFLNGADVPTTTPTLKPSQAPSTTGDFDADFEAFLSGGVVPEPAEGDGFGFEDVKDFGLSVTMGANALMGIGGTLYGLATGSMDNWAVEKSEENRVALQGMKSEGLVQAEEARAAKIAAADGEWSKAGVALWETVSDSQLLSMFLAEQIPMLVPGAGAGRLAGVGLKSAGVSTAGQASGATMAALGTGAALQGADSAGQAYDQLQNIPRVLWLENEDVKALMATGASVEEAIDEVMHDMSQDTFAAAAAVSFAANKLIPGAKILEQKLAGVKLGAGTRAANALKGTIGETIGEGIEEGSGQLLANVAEGRVDESVDITEGVGEATGMGMAAGPLGGVAGLTSQVDPTSNPTPLDEKRRSFRQEVVQNLQALEGQANREELKYKPPTEEALADAEAIINAGSLEEAIDEATARSPAPQGSYPGARTENEAPVLAPVAQADEVEVEASYFDPRLKRTEYREALAAARDFDLQDQSQTGSAIIRSKQYDTYEDQQRAERNQVGSNVMGSTAPAWAQGLRGDENTSYADIRKAIDKALAGDRLGTKQERIVTAILDTHQNMRVTGDDYDGRPSGELSPVELKLVELRTKREQRRSNVGDVPVDAYTDDVFATAGQTYVEEEYEGLDPELRIGYDLADRLDELKPNAGDQVIAESISQERSVSDTLDALEDRINAELAAEAESGREAGRPEQVAQTEVTPGQEQAVQPDPSAQTTTEEVDLLGQVPVQAQALADAERAKDEARNTGEADMTGTLFGADIAQTDLTDDAADPGGANPSSEEIDAAANAAATSPQNDLAEPTQNQIEADNYKKGEPFKLNGLDIVIENPRDSIRKGVDDDGTEWENTLAAHYGDIKRTEGADGDSVDVFVGQNPESTQVFVIDQIDQETGRFDEHKVMMGFNSWAEAEAAYLGSYDAGWKVGPVKTVTPADFKEWIDNGDTTQPFGGAVTPSYSQGFPVPGGRVLTQGETSNLPQGFDYKNTGKRVGGSRERVAGQKLKSPAIQYEINGWQFEVDNPGFMSWDEADRTAERFYQERVAVRDPANERRARRAVGADQAVIDDLLAEDPGSDLVGAINEPSNEGAEINTTPETSASSTEKEAIEQLEALENNALEEAEPASGRVTAGAAEISPPPETASKQEKDLYAARVSLDEQFDAQNRVIDAENEQKYADSAKSMQESPESMQESATNIPENIPEGAAAAATAAGLEPDSVGWSRGRGPIKNKFAAVVDGSKGNYFESPAQAIKDAMVFAADAAVGRERKASKIKAMESAAAKIKRGEQPSESEWSRITGKQPGHRYARQPDISEFLVEYLGVPKNNIKNNIGDAAGNVTSDTGATYPIVWYDKLAAVLSSSPDPIEDFGEKIGGARKDLYLDGLTRDEVPAEDRLIKLSKHFPEPKYEQLIEAGVAPETLAMVKAMRDVIPAKPRKSWKLKQWAEQVRMLRGAADSMIAGNITMERWTERLEEVARERQGAWANKLVESQQLYVDLGFPAITNTGKWNIRNRYFTKWKGEENVEKWVVSEGYRTKEGFDTRAEAVEYLRGELGEGKASKPRTVKFSIYKTGSVVMCTLPRRYAPASRWS